MAKWVGGVFIGDRKNRKPLKVTSVNKNGQPIDEDDKVVPEDTPREVIIGDPGYEGKEGAPGPDSTSDVPLEVEVVEKEKDPEEK